jgi:alkylation response protein AidB-like acyl-CoA dehydrogenase
MTSLLDHQLTGRGRSAVEAARRIASQVAAPLAEQLDHDCRFPTELFAALHEEGLDALYVPQRYGGLGLGADNEHPDPLAVWLTTKAIATADSSSSHAQQVHNNITHTVLLLGTDEQKDRYLSGVVERSEVWGGWGTEQDGRPREGGPRGFTVAHRVKGGYELNGKKFYATNAGRARYGLVFAFPDDVEKPMESMLLCTVDCEGPGVTVHPEWWNSATGMRSTVSHEVELNRAFVPDEAVVGYPGSYAGEQVQARYLPQFSANFQGTGTHIFDYATSYLRERQRAEHNQYAQRYMAEAQILLVTAELLLGPTAEAFKAKQYPEAFRWAQQLRVYSQQAVQRVIDLVKDSCGSSIYMHPNPMERLLRDWNFYSRHENLDFILRSIGQHHLGVAEGGMVGSFGGDDTRTRIV